MMLKLSVLAVLAVMSCLVLPVQGQIVTGEGQDFFNCGNTQCIDEDNVTCHNNKRCRCPAGQVGDARIQCADPDDRCLCTLGGDPHLDLFSGLQSTLALPCAHTIYRARVKSRRLIVECTIHIDGRADFEAIPDNPLAAFETQVDIYVYVFKTFYRARIVRGKKPSSTLSGVEFEVEEFFTEDFVSINIPKCDVSIKYKSDKAFLSVSTSNSSNKRAMRGLCGGGCGQQQPPLPEMDAMETLKEQLQWLDKISAYDSHDMNRYKECGEVTNVLEICYKKELAINYCGNLLIQENTRSCLLQQYGGDQRGPLKGFTECIKMACQGRPCSVYQTMFPFKNCPFDGMKELLQDPDFCT